MVHGMKVKLNSEKGASAVEFAIVLPLLMVITFGIIELGLILYNKAVITNASREGARAGIVSKYNSDTGAYEPRPDDYITGVVGNYIEPFDGKCLLVDFLEPKGECRDRVVVTVTPDYSGRLSNCPPNLGDITVDVSYDYKYLVLPNLPIIPVPPFTTLGWLGNTFHLRGTTKMRMEYRNPDATPTCTGATG